MNNLQQAATQFGTPLYVYDADKIRERIVDLQTKIGKFERTEFLYAIKANFNPSIVKLIVDNGFGVDAVSVEEVLMALKSGCRLENIMYTENNMSDVEMEEAQKIGVLINFNSISRLEKYGSKFPGSRVSVRFNPNVGAASHATNITGGPGSKFGISHDRVDEVLTIIKRHNLKLVGIHQHIGSGWLEVESPKLAMEVILDLARQIKEAGGGSDLEFIDCGGGFGVPYRPDDQALDLEGLGREFNQVFKTFCAEYGKPLRLRFEPGRYVVAEAGHLVTEVTTVKSESDGRTYIGTDTGMNHLARVAMYGSYHPIRNLTNESGEMKTYDVCGNICECADFFAKDRELPLVREGDLLSIDVAGAYGMSMANHYQFRMLPMEVMVDGDQLQVIKVRESFDTLYNLYGFTL